MGTLIYNLFSSSNGQSTPLTSSSDVISFAAWSKDGDKIAYVRYNNNNWDIFVRDINTGNEYQILTIPQLKAPQCGHQLIITNYYS
jgi:Tol biopolymer transport system component